MLSIAKILKWFIITKGGLHLLEKREANAALSKLLPKLQSEGEDKENYELSGLRDAKGSVGLDQFQLFQLLKSTGHVDREELLRKFSQIAIPQEELQEWANQYLVLSGETIVPAKILLIQQVAQALNWRLMVMLSTLINDNC